MSSAVITYCGHFFHGNCLRKWLYVQETCPMCHQTVRPTPPPQSQASGDAPAAPPQSQTGPDPAPQEEDQDPGVGDDDDDGTQESDDSTPEQQQQQQEGNKPVEPQSDAVRGFRFSSSGDFVGFVSPVSSGSHVPPGKTSDTHNQDERDKDSALPSNPETAIGNAADEPSDSSGLEDGVNHSRSWIDSNNTEASGSSLQTSVKSRHRNSSENPPNSNGTFSDFDGFGEAEPSPRILRPSSSDATFSCTSTDSSD